MTTDGVVSAFVSRGPVPGHPSLQVEEDALIVDGWWPAALWLGREACLVRLDESPGTAVAAQLAEALTTRGMVAVDGDLDAPVEAVTMQRLGLIGATWQLWAADEADARAAVAAAATG
ncbi:MAG TPA: hypothetical protein VGV63_08305 [Acidimicrobiales bacterium]|nr:hypothetical protein [Acidimicrobiales bacterium]